MENLRNGQPDNQTKYTKEYFIELGFTETEADVFVPRWRSSAEQIATEQIASAQKMRTSVNQF